MRGRDFLDIAVEMAALGGEAWDRARIGRLYYGVYLEYRQYCEEHLGFSRARMAREHQVIANLIAHNAPHAAEDLRELRIARNQADYDMDIATEDIADRAIDAERLTRRLMRHPDTLQQPG